MPGRLSCIALQSGKYPEHRDDPLEYLYVLDEFFPALQVILGDSFHTVFFPGMVSSLLQHLINSLSASFERTVNTNILAPEHFFHGFPPSIEAINSDALSSATSAYR